MPFAHLMDLLLVVQWTGVLDALLSIYDDRSQQFNFGDSTLAFRPEDVVLVMNVPCVGDIVSFVHEGTSSEFERVYLNKAHNRYCDTIRENLCRLVRGEIRTEETFVKLLIVFFMTIVFFPNTFLNALAFVARYTNNLDIIGNFAWAHAIHRWVMVDLPKAANRM